MKFFARNTVLLFVFAMLALGTQVAFCEAVQFLGWDIHEHEVCATDHSHEHGEKLPCQNDCEPELEEAQLTKGESIPTPMVSEIACIQSLVTAPINRSVDLLWWLRISEPPDGLPDRFSRSFTGRFLI